MFIECEHVSACKSEWIERANLRMLDRTIAEWIQNIGISEYPKAGERNNKNALRLESEK